MNMKKWGISDPLALARACCRLESEIKAFNLTLGVSSDMAAFNDTKKKVRGFDVSPMHDPDVSVLDDERGQWLWLANPQGEIIALQGFRLDQIDTSLADWSLTNMVGTYMRRMELVVPSHAKPAKGSIAWRITGKVVYHGELWVDKPYRSRELIEHFIKSGLLLTYLKWHPDAIWCLASSHIVERGYLSRCGYSVFEPGFMRWQMISDGIDPFEALYVAEPQSIEAMMEIWASKEELFPRAPARPQPAHDLPGNGLLPPAK
jgi:hypothetical protein